MCYTYQLDLDCFQVMLFYHWICCGASSYKINKKERENTERVIASQYMEGKENRCKEREREREREREK